MPLDEDMSEDEFIEDIAPDVLAIIERDGFFAALDDVFCPSDDAITPAVCAHSFEQSEKLLLGIGIEQEHVADVLSVLRSRGAC
jgi:hypothetical protein